MTHDTNELHEDAHMVMDKIAQHHEGRIAIAKMILEELRNIHSLMDDVLSKITKEV